jgi:CDGSH-type Zn-finger protein
MAATKITVNGNGPLRVEGEFTILDTQGKEYGLAGRTSVSLCRCGLSQKKPFCDGAHRAGAFHAESQAFDLPAPKPA